MLVTLRVLFIHFFICLYMCVQVLVLCVYICASIHLLICYFCLLFHLLLIYLYTTGKLWDPILARALNLCTTNYPMLGSVGTQLFDPT